jgi:hypothetical protein
MSVVTAHSAMDFLNGSCSLESICQKYSHGLSTHYESMSPLVIQSTAEEKLRILSDIEAAEKAVVILNAFIYRRFKFHPDNRRRRLTGLFTNEFAGSKSHTEEQKELCKGFKAFIFSIRSNIFNYAPASWSIIEEPEAIWLGELIAEPSSVFDSF